MSSAISLARPETPAPAVPAGCDPVTPSLREVAAAYITSGLTPATRKTRRLGVAGFDRAFGDLDGWLAAPVDQRRSVRTEVASFVGYALIGLGVAVDVEFVVASGCHWGQYLRTTHPDQAEQFAAQARSLGFCDTEIGRMWAWLAKIALVAGSSPDGLTAAAYPPARAAVHDT